MGKKITSTQGKNKTDKSMVGQLKQFQVDSVRFLNKCQKPDRKGRSFLLNPLRIHENSPGLRDWILSYGIYWIFRQIDFHPN